MLLTYDAEVLELVDDNIADTYTESKQVVSNLPGKYSVIYKTDSCSLQEGIASTTTYKFKVKAGTVPQTVITLDPGVVAAKSISVDIKESTNNNISDKENDKTEKGNKESSEGISKTTIIISVAAVIILVAAGIFVKRKM